MYLRTDASCPCPTAYNCLATPSAQVSHVLSTGTCVPRAADRAYIRAVTTDSARGEITAITLVLYALGFWSGAAGKRLVSVNGSPDTGFMIRWSEESLSYHFGVSVFFVTAKSFHMRDFLLENCDHSEGVPFSEGDFYVIFRVQETSKIAVHYGPKLFLATVQSLYAMLPCLNSSSVKSHRLLRKTLRK